MARWGNWQPIEGIWDNISLNGKRGLYQIRMVNRKDVPIPIPRIRGMDSEGMLYMGKSTRLGSRVKDFLLGQHSGGGFYYRTYYRLRRYKPYRGYSLQFRVAIVAESQLYARERSMLQRYLYSYCELPPFNCTVPGGK